MASCSRLLAYGLAVIVLALAASACGAEPEEPERAAAPPAPEEAPPEEEEAPRREEEEAPRREEEEAPPPEARQLVWVGVEGADEVALVDVAAGEVLERHDTPGGPHNVTVADDGTAAAALYGGDHLALVTQGERALVELGGTPHDVKALDDLFVVANEAAERIDLVRGGEGVGSIRLKAQPHDLAIVPGEMTAWVTLNRTDELAVVDLDERDVVRYVPTGQRPHDLLFAPDGRLWVTDWDGLVHVFRDAELEASLDLGEEAHHLTFTPDGDEVWITDHGVNRVFVLDTETVEVVASLAVPGAPHHVAITPDGELAAVADHDNETVVVYDVERRERVRTIALAGAPHGVWAVPPG